MLIDFKKYIKVTYCETILSLFFNLKFKATKNRFQSNTKTLSFKGVVIDIEPFDIVNFQVQISNY